jgi:hypothetical protein
VLRCVVCKFAVNGGCHVACDVCAGEMRLLMYSVCCTTRLCFCISQKKNASVRELDPVFSVPDSANTTIRVRFVLLFQCVCFGTERC